ncbi:hypothetical protein SAMD00019534_107820 [Acytostelium subglobosum LB1]|nr:hypothetical protein SAMD00019534_107820 [Acytostelium subglobosum LB1]GAM27606.1 hypothetical protein SAMD00019534_107820 [Acytostelium subglobosum LB1]|eukprot:XP_012749265.1 hypothetical protein SAMD00019534_107820 [Acytostelium subglobosum LB1]
MDGWIQPVLLLDYLLTPLWRFPDSLVHSNSSGKRKHQQQQQRQKIKEPQ